ncbi:MAG: hypothetical protein V1494_03470 [Candidatus Diapherotrites archaeon]
MLSRDRPKQRVITNPVKKRNIIWQPKKQGALIAFFSKRLKNPNFFENLPSAGLGSYRIKKFYFKGIVVLVKDTGEYGWHGGNYKEIEETFKKYHKAIKQGIISASRHVLRSPKVYAKIGQYIIMEFIEKIPERGQEKRSLAEAKEELRKNFNTLVDSGIIKEKDMPQLDGRDIICFGNTNPEKPGNGKWILFYPKDQV